MPEKTQMGSQAAEGKTSRRGRRSRVRQTTASRNALIEQYQDFVEIVVTRLIRSMGLPVTLKEDFVSAAFVGLIEAAGRFDSSRGMEFRSYAYLRIRGAVVDHIRLACDLSGHAYRKFRALEAAHELREQELEDAAANRKSTLAQKARAARSVIEKNAVAFKLAAAVAREERDDPRKEQITPEEVLEKKQDFQKIRSLVATLPEKERTIIEQYYFHDRKMVDVAQQFAGLSKSWVSRLHDRALEMLRDKWERAVTDMAA